MSALTEQDQLAHLAAMSDLELLTKARATLAKARLLRGMWSEPSLNQVVTFDRQPIGCCTIGAGLVAAGTSSLFAREAGRDRLSLLLLPHVPEEFLSSYLQARDKTVGPALASELVIAYSDKLALAPEGKHQALKLYDRAIAAASVAEQPVCAYPDCGDPIMVVPSSGFGQPAIWAHRPAGSYDHAAVKAVRGIHSIQAGHDPMTGNDAAPYGAIIRGGTVPMDKVDTEPQVHIPVFDGDAVLKFTGKDLPEAEQQPVDREFVSKRLAAEKAKDSFQRGYIRGTDDQIMRAGPHRQPGRVKPFDKGFEIDVDVNRWGRLTHVIVHVKTDEPNVPSSAHGYALRHPNDADNPKLAERLALGRALSLLAQDLEEHAKDEL